METDGKWIEQQQQFLKLQHAVNTKNKLCKVKCGSELLRLGGPRDAQSAVNSSVFSEWSG